MPYGMGAMGAAIKKKASAKKKASPMGKAMGGFFTKGRKKAPTRKPGATRTSSSLPKSPTKRPVRVSAGGSIGVPSRRPPADFSKFKGSLGSLQGGLTGKAIGSKSPAKKVGSWAAKAAPQRIGGSSSGSMASKMNASRTGAIRRGIGKK